VFKMHKIRYPT